MPLTRRSASAARRRPTLLVPVDGSAAARRALAQACVFARKLRAEIVGLHVVTPFELALYAGRRPSIVTAMEFERRATRISERILAGLREAAAAAGVPCRCRTLWEGAVEEAILRTARAERCTFIVMATHGRTGLQRMLLGSVTQKVLAGSRVPVIILPLKA